MAEPLKQSIGVIISIVVIIVMIGIFLVLVVPFLGVQEEMAAYDKVKLMIERACNPENPAVDSTDPFLPVNNEAQHYLSLRYYEIIVENNEIRLSEVFANPDASKSNCNYAADRIKEPLSCPVTTVSDARIVSSLGKEQILVQALRQPDPADPGKFTLLLSSDPSDAVQNLC